MNEDRVDLSALLAPEMRHRLDEPKRFQILKCCGAVLSVQGTGWIVQFKLGCWVSGLDRHSTIDHTLDYLRFAPHLWPLRSKGVPPPGGRPVRARAPENPALEAAIRSFHENGRVDHDQATETVFTHLRWAAGEGQTADDVLRSVGLFLPPGEATWYRAIWELVEIWPRLQHDDEGEEVPRPRRG